MQRGTPQLHPVVRLLDAVGRETTVPPSAHAPPWPDLPYPAWRDTCATLHLWTQIVGKIRLAYAPWSNHSWHVTLAVTARGLATPLISTGTQDFEIEFDFVEHKLRLRAADGREQHFPLRPMAVADFYAETLNALAELGVQPRIDTTPNELPDPIPFDRDRTHAAYDGAFAGRFWRVLLRVQDVFTEFRTSFIGKVSPVHFFWGSFDLAVTRFSGRTAPLHPGGIPHLSDAVTREAYSHEVSSAGFWPGGGAYEEAAFYSYAYPQADGFAAAAVRPAQAFYHAEMGEFLLPYDAVRTADDPRRTLLDFLDSTYIAAAEAGRWDRAALECAPGVPGRPRPI